MQVLREYLIGTGGWAYFKIPGLRPLVAYSRAFNFVEVNSTFYQMPEMKQVEKWRKVVPADFRFAVRANRSITHREKLQPTEDAIETFCNMKQICETLKTDLLHLQTPTSFKLDHKSILGFHNLASSLKLGKLRLALELRGTASDKLPNELIQVMQDKNMVHSTDLSKSEMPAYESDTLYTRLFGMGSHNRYQPTDEELEEIDSRISNTNSQRTVMSFHFVRMYKDAARMKIYKETGKFPKVTRSTGLLSLDEILKEDSRFPASKHDLVATQGWKVFDITEDTRLRANQVLQKLPDKIYNDINEVMNELSSIMR